MPVEEFRRTSVAPSCRQAKPAPVLLSDDIAERRPPKEKDVLGRVWHRDRLPEV
jgi:hypothetical protein